MDQRTHRIIPAVWVIVTNEHNEYFLLKRANTGWQDNTFCVPSGHIESMESPKQAAIRELQEESGIVGKIEDLMFHHVVFNKSNDGTETERVNIFFTLNVYEGEPHLAEPEKASECGWYSNDTLPELTVTIAHALKETKEGNLYSELYY